MGSLSETYDFLIRLFESGERLSSPTDFVGTVHNAIAGQLALWSGAQGANLTMTSGSSSFEDALLTSALLTPHDEYDSKILLVQEVADCGRWTLPGGWADVNETPSEAVVKEVLEESGFETRVVKLLAVYDREKQGHIPPLPFHIYKLFFLCEITGGSACAQGETSAVDFFGEHEIQELSVSRVNEKQVRWIFLHARNPEQPTDFD